ncbi:MAG: RNA polymerase subunit sigma [Candidatus Cloacimonadota bacterium]|nr:MAG: RNA polymerase subunit sigma [Candidatus Cloacimonadota bacterium]
MENIFNDKALQQYLNEISKIPALSREEEQKYAKLAQNGDQDAIDLLVKSNLKFVVRVASRYQNRGLSLSELISEGNMGLIKAIGMFDYTKDIKLISYAVWWIKQKITSALSEKSNTINYPSAKYSLKNRVRYTSEQIFGNKGYYPEPEEIAAELNVPTEAVHKVLADKINTLSLDVVSSGSNNQDASIGDFISSGEKFDPKTLYYREKLSNKINDSISRLSERESYIIKAYFGLDSGKKRNFAKLGKELGLSRERVRQIQKEALDKIFKDTVEEREKDIDWILTQE